MFQVLPLSQNEFSPLFAQSDKELLAQGIIRTKADTDPAYPCRVSLDFAQIGESVLLLNYEHHKAKSPYNSRYAIFVRENVEQIKLSLNELPPVFKRESPIAVRAFEKNGMLKMAEIAMGPKVADLFEKFFAIDDVEYLHAHYATYGCFAAKIVRA